MTYGNALRSLVVCGVHRQFNNGMLRVRSADKLDRVVDAPNQQGQDDINLPKVLKFVATHLPAEAQIIISSELDTEHFFDNKVLFEDPYGLLLEQPYDESMHTVEPLVTRMYAALQESSGA